MQDELTSSTADFDAQQRAADRAAQAALIENFGIRGLYGYRNISLSSRHAGTILIAKNGSGKTTLLGALDAFLRLQLTRLRKLEFREIFCKIRDVNDELVLTHEDIIAFLQPPSEGAVHKLAARAGMDPQKLFSFLLEDYHAAFQNYLYDHDPNSPVNVLSRAFGYDANVAEKEANKVFSTLFERTPKLLRLHQCLTTALAPYEVVYLPTYRRVELALADGEKSLDRGQSRAQFKLPTGGLHTADIQFGLSDISERLVQLNQQIISSSNISYREISENIINELIRGFEVNEKVQVPTPEELKLFFSRLQSGGPMGPYYRISAPDFEKIYSGDGVPTESRKFLTYFLGKLYGVIKITKEIEQPVEQFVVSCNKYLRSVEPSTSTGSVAPYSRLAVIDAKELKMDRTNLSVHVASIPPGRKISLDALSSGEKQMISLFAKLYLYPKKKIVLIDEPELSLSIDWQRGILVDVLLSPLCEQVVAITHSPFVFDNSLEPFARSLTMEVEPPESPQLSLENKAGATISGQ